MFVDCTSLNTEFRRCWIMAMVVLIGTPRTLTRLDNLQKKKFGVQKTVTFEPARGLNEKSTSDAVVCVDVLEHVFIADITSMLNELFSLASKLLVINVACYKAAALLPNGENAHITIRSPDWWKGAIDTVSAGHPNVEALLICSTKFKEGMIYEPHSYNDWLLSTNFEVIGKFTKFSAT